MAESSYVTVASQLFSQSKTHVLTIGGSEIHPLLKFLGWDSPLVDILSLNL